MSFDLALYPASGPGLGHLMRCMALAQWAVELKAKAIVMLAQDAPALQWPCAVARASNKVTAKANVHIADAPGSDYLHGLSGPALWRVVDVKADEPRDYAGYIYPHFGAEPFSILPTFVGPSWMPLRQIFSRDPAIIGKERAAWGVSYRAQRAGYKSLEGRHEYGISLALSIAREAVVPASTVAYEAFALGCPVRLLRDITPDCDRIGAAMVAEGVAVWDDEPVRTLSPARIGDGLGAKGLLEALL